MIVVVFVFSVILFSRYAKVGPNQALIVSGRQVQLPDGTRVGFRIVKGGGTFVLPIIEKVDLISLEVFTIEMPKTKARTSEGKPVEADCVAQVKIKGDDSSIVAAAGHFLSKSDANVKSIVRPVLEKHVRTTLGNLSVEEIRHDLDACATSVQAAASLDLGNMGLGMVSFTVQDVHAA